MVVNEGGSGKQEAGSFLPPKRNFLLKRFALGTLCTLVLSLCAQHGRVPTGESPVASSSLQAK